MGIMENGFRLFLNLLILFTSSGTFFTSLAVAHPRRQDLKQTFSTDWLPTKGGLLPRQAQNAKQSQYDHPSLANLKPKSVRSVVVKCYPDSMEIVVNAKMFEVGVRIDGTKLRLGVEALDRCKATLTAADEFTIFAGLLDCGTKHLVTEDLLIYTNYLMYSPQSTTEIIKMENAIIPIECRYGRKYSVSSDVLQPTWIPYKSTVSAEETLDFDLKIMNSDWLHGGGSKVYLLGDPMNIEASVRVSQHLRLRVFIKSCVATLNPDKDSVPRYVFIDNGCLVDSQLLGSRSQFLPRTVDDKLQLTIDSFRFYGENNGELFFTCHLTAVPVTDTEEPQHKACSYSDKRWRSADGNDLLCSQCQEQNDATHYHSAPKTSSVKTQNTGSWGSEWEQVTALGPLIVLPGEWKDVPVTPRRSERASALVDPGARRLAASHQSKSRVNSKSLFTDTHESKVFGQSRGAGAD